MTLNRRLSASRGTPAIAGKGRRKVMRRCVCGGGGRYVPGAKKKPGRFSTLWRRRRYLIFWGLIPGGVGKQAGGHALRRKNSCDTTWRRLRHRRGRLRVGAATASAIRSAPATTDGTRL